MLSENLLAVKMVGRSKPTSHSCRDVYGVQTGSAQLDRSHLSQGDLDHLRTGTDGVGV